MTAREADPPHLPAGAYVHEMDGKGLYVKTPTRVVTWNELAALNDALAAFPKSTTTSTDATLEALIRDAIASKRSALGWQAYIKEGKTRPFSPTFARESAEYWQKRLVQLLTQIIAGDEATLAAHGGQP